MDKAKTQNQAEEKGVPHYCDNFDKELNYKLWSTMGARFSASKRLEKKAYFSSLAINFCSGYVILFSLFSILFLNTLFPAMATSTNAIVTFVSITLSLFIIIFSQTESNSHYDLRASKFHSCGLEISKLYKELRFLKDNRQKDGKFLQNVYEISKKYDIILAQYENHEKIDYLMFKLDKPDYETHRMGRLQQYIVKLKYYKEFAMYWTVIILPIFLFVGLYYFVKINSKT